ncbi:hypothetical protein DL240_12765 [Lujinxingia litoralis]|uniref:SPOR domain-containing protein n=1 Tax=Lujinxingia litoralis TaxID=2211119 RepID=A0A328C9S1_9DELT|nr:SPOR domain-containing protein [Lujinxingia litoralis]RAL21720.1 hypothetical protein DL240_12765 [Lujinxingia litoralis]
MSRRRTHKQERGFSPGRLILATGVLSLVFSAGLIAGQRVMLEDALPPLISVGQPALASTGVVAEVAAQDDAKENRRDAIFSFYESLTRPEARPLIARKPAAAQAAPPKAAPEEAARPQAAPDAPKQGAASPAESPAQPAAPDAAEAARYTLQVASHPTMERARAEMDRLSAQGLSPHVIAADIPGQGKFYRVRIGKFPTVEKARAFQAQAERTHDVRTFVTPL